MEPCDWRLVAFAYGGTQVASSPMIGDALATRSGHGLFIPGDIIVVIKNHVQDECNKYSQAILANMSLADVVSRACRRMT